MITDLQKRLDEVAAEHGVPGAAIAVWADGELVEAATGVVNRNTGVETTVDSVFQVGSTTKVWTAALVMQLVDEKLVELDRPVRDYLPEFAVADGAEKAITVRHLLTHTGGFDGDLFEDTGRGDDCLDKYVEFLHGAGHVHAPGALFSYCNAGYCVLGALVARMRGTTWERVMRERLLDPLGATHSALLPEEAILFRAAAGHIGPENTVHHTWGMPRSNAPAGSTMCLAPRELVRFGRMFVAGGLTEDGTRLLSEESVTAMRTRQADVPGISGLLADRWGLGFELFDWGGEVYGHDGGTIGQSTFWRVVPGADFAIAMSTNGGDFLGLLVDVALPVIREATGLTVPDFPVPAETPQAVDLTPYTGRYEGPMLAYEVTEGDGGLDVTLIPGEFMTKSGTPRTTTRFVHHSDHSFVTAEPKGGGHETITFVMKDGRAAYIHNGRALPRA
ncbi:MULTISPECIES: serine hydrolase domain-containing protein [Streptosporangium]|uniref:CubicO group peptidase (Beta-lactamase class C family) n=1 Tax=Streptosporangium brasiliense TaxID=47480 RepID=A0ABT9RG24_9ACTN|nr:serine hydrolase domain-containing protein [Streptosporangium brasiliense]MDP9867679.1 CubicO group peptidase (beta-lactamase class C family) [Streptosporangium brasiliense]